MNMHSSEFDDESVPPRAGVPARAGEEDRDVRAPPGGALSEPSRYSRALGEPSSAAYAAEEPSSAYDLLKYWGIFLKHRRLFATAAAVALALGFTVTFLTTPLFRAATTVQINKETNKIVQFKDDVSGAEAAVSDLQFYQTEYELLKSRSLAQHVVADLDLANQPTFLGGDGVSPWTKLRQMVFGGDWKDGTDLATRTEAAVRHVQDSVTVSPVVNSALVRLSVDDPKPVWAQKIANAMAQAFIKMSLERRYDATAYARSFLQDHLQEIKLKLENSERALVAYAQKKQIVNLGHDQSGNEQSPLATADLVAVNAELAKVRAERIQNEQLWTQAQAADGLGLPQILEDKTIQTLRDKRAVLGTDYQDKLNTFKPDFPDMQKLRAQINEVDREIAASVALIKQSIKAKYEASKAQEDLLVAQLGKSKGQVLDAQDLNIEYTVLQREVDTDRTLYNALLQRYKDVGVDSGVGVNNISVVDPALLPTSRFSPSLTKNLGVALVLGLLIAAAAAYLIELLDNTFKTPEDAEEALQVPVIGLAPLLPKTTTVKAAFADPHSALSEAYRSARTALQFSTEDGVPKDLLVTSSRPGEGKSTVALALARNFTQLSLRVLLIDADLRKPSLHKMLGCDNSVGLSNVLVGSEVVQGLFHRTETPGLTFMASGPLPPNPAELLAGPKLQSLLALVHEKFDLIIIDGPPVMGIADSLLLASAASGVLMVVAAGEAPKDVVKRALKRLHFARARMIGVMLNKFDAKKISYGYGYGYGYGDDHYYSYGKDTPKLAPRAGD